MGPVFIHQESDVETYHEFFSYLKIQLAKSRTKLEGIEVTYDKEFFGTDEGMMANLHRYLLSSEPYHSRKHIHSFFS